MKRMHLFLLIVGIAILATFVTVEYYRVQQVLAVKTIETDVFVTTVNGLNLNDDKVHFGGVTPGSGAVRKIHVAYSSDARVHAFAKGDIAPFVSVSENDFFLPANTRKDVIFTVDIPLNTTLGNYTGELVFLFLRP